MRHSHHHSDQSLSNFLFGMVIGLLTGGILSLMYSPSSGEENRRKAKQWADDTKQWADDKKETLKEEIQNPYSKARQFVDEKRFTIEEQWNRWQNQKKAERTSVAKQKESDAYDTETGVSEVPHNLSDDVREEHEASHTTT
jgi:gas vesicle protein